MGVRVNGTPAPEPVATTGTQTIAGAKTFTSAVVVAVDDATNNSTSTLATWKHTTTGTAAAGIGCATLFQAEDAAGNVEDVAKITATLTTATNAAETSNYTIQVRTGGSALRDVVTVYGSSGVYFGASNISDPASGFAGFGNGCGVKIADSGNTLRNALVSIGAASDLVVGGLNWATTYLQTGGGGSIQLIAGASAAMVIAPNYAQISRGFQRVRTPVADAAKSVSAFENLICYTSISQARVVSLPAAATMGANAVLTVVDESGSCDGTKTISVTPNGAETINGVNAAHVLNSAYGKVTLLCTGAKWVVIG